MKFLLLDLHSNACMAKLPARLNTLGVECYAYGDPEALFMKSGLIKQKYGAQKTDGNLTEKDFLSGLIFAINHCDPDFLITNDEFVIHSLKSKSAAYNASKTSLPEEIQKFVNVVECSFYPVIDDAYRPNSLKKAEKAGFHVPTFETIVERDGINKALTETSRPFYLKESLSIGRQGVFYIKENAKDAWVHSALENIASPSPSHPFIAQQPSDGTEVTISFAAYKGELLGYNVVKPLKTIYNGGPSTVIEALFRPDWGNYISNFIKLTSYNGFGGFDAMENGNELPDIIEANMRLTHTVHCSHKLGSDLLQLFINAAQDALPKDFEPVHEKQESTFALYPEELMRDQYSDVPDSVPFDGPWSDPRVIAHMTRYVRSDVVYPSHDLESRYKKKLGK